MFWWGDRPKMIDPPASWRASGLARIVAVLRATGKPARLVGGCVRDALLGLPAADLDVATPLLPEEGMERLRAAGIKVIPTGLAHGTITAIADGVSVEITTLRRDLETDGRHATVAFTDDWHADAARRDLSINALFADLDGTIHDPIGGLSDLEIGRIRFVGDPATRIAEDYLRIPRYFRFFARFGRLPPDRDILTALSAGMEGVGRLAGERIKAEAFALLGLAEPMPGVELAVKTGYWAALWGERGDLATLSRLIEREQAHGLTPDPLRRLAALAGPAVAPPLAERLRLSRLEANRLLAIPSALTLLADADPLRSLALRRQIGAVTARDAALIAGREADLGAWLAVTASEAEPMPLTAADLIALGIAPGPEIGQRLAALQGWWDAANGAPDREACLRQAAAGLLSSR